MNLVVLQGKLSSLPVHRSLASGSSLVQLELTTDTAIGAASVPVAWFDPVVAPAWEVGTELVVAGVVRRRFFRSGGVTQSRTEVVASDVVESRRRQAARRVVARALQPIAPPE
jgi:single-strand DNA-binding protein